MLERLHVLRSNRAHVTATYTQHDIASHAQDDNNTYRGFDDDVAGERMLAMGTLKSDIERDGEVKERPYDKIRCGQHLFTWQTWVRFLQLFL